MYDLSPDILEQRALRIVEILMTDPELAIWVALHPRKQLKPVVKPWEINHHGRDFNIHRWRADGVSIAAYVEPHDEGGWHWHVNTRDGGVATDIVTSVQDAYQAADAALEADGHILVPGYPTASAWSHDRDQPSTWARWDFKGNKVVDVWGSGVQYSWSHAAPPGRATRIYGPFDTLEDAQADADRALQGVGWALATKEAS